jgi:small Trp-rich protein
MLFLLVGLALLLMKYMAIDPVAAWSWWIVLAPFGLAVAWWSYADASGLTKKRASAKMDRKKQERLDKQREKLGMGTRKK